MPTVPSKSLVVVLLAVVAACGAQPKLQLPPQVAGQAPADYQLEAGRGIALGRVVVVTEGKPGFGAISNPMLVQFFPGDGEGSIDERRERTVTVTEPKAYVFGGAAGRPSVWPYRAPGLMALSLEAGSYDGLAIAYPDHSHDSSTPTSIPAPAAAFAFTPIAVDDEQIVYVGDIEIRQHYSWTDMLVDRIQVEYVVTDNYDKAVEDFRFLYPQFVDHPVERRVIHP